MTQTQEKMNALREAFALWLEEEITNPNGPFGPESCPLDLSFSLWEGILNHAPENVRLGVPIRPDLDRRMVSGLLSVFTKMGLNQAWSFWSVEAEFFL